MRIRRLLLSVFPLAILFFAAFPGMAQSGTGEVNGTVTDPAGAVVVGAAVSMVNQDTQMARQVSTNSTGYFIFVGVLPGRYNLRVDSSGFKAQEVPNLQLGVNQTLT